MEAFVYSSLGVFVAEIGDKTQLLALLLAARFSHKAAVSAGILAAALLNHALSVCLGLWLAQAVSPTAAAAVAGISFIAVGLWMAVPDKEHSRLHSFGLGAFFTTLILFFIAETGDKTQIATTLLALKYRDGTGVTAGSVIGLCAACIPVVYLGPALFKRVPAHTVRRAACALFCLLGIITLAGAFAAP